MKMIKSAGRFQWVWLLPLLFSFESPKMMKVKAEGGISFIVPKDWHPMDELDFRERYPSVRAPLAAYTDADRMVDFSVNVSATQWPDADLALAQKFFKASIYNLFDRVDMVEEGIREVYGRKFVYFVFESTIKGNPRELGQSDPILTFNHVQYLVEPSRTLAFSFHCPRRMRAEWQPVAQEMMMAVRVKK